MFYLAKRKMRMILRKYGDLNLKSPVQLLLRNYEYCRKIDNCGTVTINNPNEQKEIVEQLL